ncbi:putative HTH-type transcriptional regulator [compost metagenome]
MAFSRSWLRKLGLKAEYLAVLYGDGRSMEPTIAHDDVLLMDTSETALRNGKIYVIRRADGAIIIKRLIQNLTGTWIIRSDNENKREHPDEIATDSDVGNLEVLGRIVWHGGEL